MAFTYLILNLVFIACVVALCIRYIRKPSITWLVTLGALLLLTLIFDNLMLWADLFRYDTSKLLGFYVGLAPIEDFFYAILAAIIVPVLWKRFAKHKERRHA
jgi:lycopene cyclase domain-containing protein